MNEAIAFDTHRFIKHLTATGFTEAQAEALAEEQVMFLNANLVTKTDIAQVEAALKVDIATINERITQVEAALKADIATINERIAQVEATLKTDIARVEATLKTDIVQAKHEITKWMVGIVLGVAAVQTTLIVGLL